MMLSRRTLPRLVTALFLTAIYGVITMSPLAPLVMRSAVIAHAITGECAGDQNICGCPPEQHANHTCCCWKNKPMRDHGRKKTANCCGKKQQPVEPTLICACPCGGSKQLAFWGPLKSEHLPPLLGEDIPATHNDISFSSYQGRRYDRFGDPPDYPPKVAVLS